MLGILVSPPGPFRRYAPALFKILAERKNRSFPLKKVAHPKEKTAVSGKKRMPGSLLSSSALPPFRLLY